MGGCFKISNCSSLILPPGLYFGVCCALQDSTRCSPGHVDIHKVPALGETQCVNGAREGVQRLPAYLCHHHSSRQNQHLCPSLSLFCALPCVLLKEPVSPISLFWELLLGVSRACPLWLQCSLSKVQPSDHHNYPHQM